MEEANPAGGAATTNRHRPGSVDLDPARRLLFSWTLSRFLDTRPPSTVVYLSREDTVGGAMAGRCESKRDEVSPSRLTPEGES